MLPTVRPRLRLLSPLPLLAGLGLLAACGAPAPYSPAAPAPATALPTAAPPPPPARLETVRQGFLGTVSDAGFLIGIARGYFAEGGIEIERTQVPSGPEAIQFLATGQLDILGGGPGVGLNNAFAQGSRVRVVADKGHGADARFGLNPILVRRELYESGQVRDFTQLRGLRIAISGLTGSNRVDLNKMLERAGLTEADVDVVGMSFPDMIPALANGSIDLAFTNEPSATAGVERGAAVRLGTIADVYPNHQAAFLMFSEPFSTDRRDTAQRYMVAYIRGLRDYNDAFRAGKGKAEVIQVLGQMTGVSDPALYDKMALPGLNPDGYVNKESLAEDQRYYLALGLQREPIDIDQLVDHQFIDYAVQQLGPYRSP